MKEEKKRKGKGDGKRKRRGDGDVRRGFWRLQLKGIDARALFMWALHLFLSGTACHDQTFKKRYTIRAKRKWTRSSPPSHRHGSATDGAALISVT